jgi:hypothetical protein
VNDDPFRKFKTALLRVASDPALQPILEEHMQRERDSGTLEIYGILADADYYYDTTEGHWQPRPPQPTRQPEWKCEIQVFRDDGTMHRIIKNTFPANTQAEAQAQLDDLIAIGLSQMYPNCSFQVTPLKPGG